MINLKTVDWINKSGIILSHKITEFLKSVDLGVKAATRLVGK